MRIPAEYRYTGLLYDLNNSAKEFFKRALAAAPIAKEYLKSRGLTQETIETFEIGWAPNETRGAFHATFECRQLAAGHRPSGAFHKNGARAHAGPVSRPDHVPDP